MTRRQTRSDVTPPGRESQVKALKEKPGIDNPWAVAWASYGKDAADEDYDDATEYLSGEPSGPVPGTDEYEVETENEPGEAFGEPDEMEDSYDEEGHPEPSFPEHAHAQESYSLPIDQMGGHMSGEHHSASGMHGKAAEDDDQLLDDSEVAAGEDLPTEEEFFATDPAVKPGASEGDHEGEVEDPEPENLNYELTEEHGE